MEQTVINATEYREIPLAQLNESKTNPRRAFDQTSLKELADFVPGNKIGLLWRLSFCGRCCDDPDDNRRSVISRSHNGQG